MRRTLLIGLTTAAVLSTSLLVAPASSAANDPTVNGASAKPKSQVIKISGSPVFETLTASFDDPDATIANAVVTIRWPGGKTSSTVNATTNGNTRSFSYGNFRPSNAMAPGVYKVAFKAVPKPAFTYATPVVARTKFTVTHQTRMFVVASSTSTRPGARVKFSGSFYPHYSHAKGKKLILSYDKAGGPRKFVKKATTEVTKTATYKFSRIRVYKTGRFKVTFKGDKFSNKSQATVKYTVS